MDGVSFRMALPTILMILMSMNEGLIEGISDFFTSTRELRFALDTETLISQDIRYFLSLETQRLDRLEADVARLYQQVFKTPDSLKYDPVLYWKVTSLCDQASKLASGRLTRNLRSAFSYSPLKDWWPTRMDLVGAALGVCRLRETYNLTVSQIRKLRLPDIADLTADDLKEIAEGSARRRNAEDLEAWTLAALHQARLEGVLTPDFQRDITTLREQVSTSTNVGKESDEFLSMCVAEGDVRHPGSKLRCKMSTIGGHPFLLLQPFKIEILSEDPRIVVFADFLRPTECEIFRSISMEKLFRAKIYSGFPEDITSNRRTTKIAWLTDDQHPTLRKVSQRIELATGLTLTSSEMYQVANYGLGGHYVPHPDYASFDNIPNEVQISSGNRLATMLMYLADVSGGGATAFVRMKQAVKPTLGTALFWYNLKPYDGPVVNMSFWNQRRVGDERTWHMGCPVLIGSKWIVTKWIRERNQGIVTYRLPN